MKAWPSFSGLAPAQLEAVGDRMGEHEYEGAELVGCTAKMLRRLLKGSDGEEAVPLLLAARDAHLATERKQQQAAATKIAAVAAAKAEAAATKSTAAAGAEAVAKAAPSCGCGWMAEVDGRG